MKYSILIALSILALCGCQKPAGNEESPAQVASAAAQSPAPASLAKLSENGMLSVDPAMVSACAGSPEAVAAKVKWDASPLGTQGVQIWMQTPGEEKKLWLAGLPVGEDVTGPWLRVGSSITLTNGEDQKELARIVISSNSCK